MAVEGPIPVQFPRYNRPSLRLPVFPRPLRLRSHHLTTGGSPFRSPSASTVTRAIGRRKRGVGRKSDDGPHAHRGRRRDGHEFRLSRGDDGHGASSINLSYRIVYDAKFGESNGMCRNFMPIGIICRGRPCRHRMFRPNAPSVARKMRGSATMSGKNPADLPGGDDA